ncbi:MAG: glycosyltransferase family 4 protein [Deltaproteobacteria bacterium]|uniref:Glycosyltransferase family 4 protein n=1 Tax=Candidatus Zymogenus saltonus TaxID=2844893 RepID=A0A9D8KBR5_9DELT|nr:glycosyltransferase family 4 protein [Candidatus Zymogenus saltonus]
MKRLAFLMHKGFEGRFRVKEFIPYFEENGVEVSLVRVPGGMVKRLSTFRRLREFDVVIIQRKLLTALDLFFVKRYAKKSVFDFDDAIMYRSSRHKSQHSRGRMRKFRNMMKSVDAVFAGNSYLAGLAAKFTTPERIHIFPTVVDLNEYGIKEYKGKREKNDGFTVGWIGTSTNLHYLKAIGPALEEFAGKYKGVRLKIVCDKFFDLNGVDVIKKEWIPEEVEADLKSFDVGVMPLTDDIWARGKCGFKVVQYLATGVPAVASPVGINSDLVINGDTGFRAENHDEWVKSLSSLYEDRGLIEKMGLSGRRLVEKGFSLQAMAPRYLEVLRKIAGE